MKLLTTKPLTQTTRRPESTWPTVRPLCHFSHSLHLSTSTFLLTRRTGTVALCLAKKSTRAYRGLNSAMALLHSDPEAASAPIPLHLRNAPTTLMKNLGYGKEYKYPPNYVDGIVKQEYLPDSLVGRKFLDDRDLGELIDEDDDAYAALGETDPY
ncbi:hypothetical protein ABW21_db0201043 [Orbilia brochopaga]|nr:hypothetical protein ABW21_db0201043 [Drechslerella brochopaga]